MTIKTFSELNEIRTFEDRYEYLRIGGKVGVETFGYHRYLNQLLYKSDEWLRVRDEIIIRDDGLDLGVRGYDIFGSILVHHINPITIEDVRLKRFKVFNHENLISTSLNTHNAIHYGNKNLLPQIPIMRSKYDTCPWRK